MNRTEHAESLATYTASQCPFAIECIPQVLEDIRMAVVAAFHGLSHGGLEIGGILLGSQSADRVTITDFRPLECEHAFGPTFRLSDNDHTRLTDAIAGAQASGQTVVGWFHSHTRTGIFLSEADLEIHNRHFKDLQQVALVLKPIPLKPTLCGFFFREADGSIHSQKGYQEFELESWSTKDGEARAVSPQRDEHVVSAPAAPQPRRRPQETEALPQTAQQPAEQPSPTDDQPNPEAAFAPPHAGVSQPWQSPRRAPLRRPSSGLHFHWARALAGVVVVLALGATYAYLTRQDTGVQTAGAQPAADQVHGVQAVAQQPAVDQALGLKIQRQGADLILTWNRNAPDVQNATGGLLSIKDGPKRKEMGLSAEQLRSANILIAPESDNVEVQLTVLLPNQRIASESSIAILPAQRSTGPVVLKTTVPSSTYTAAQVRLEPREVKASKLFVAPPGRNRAPDTRPMDQPPASKGSDPQARIPSSAIADFRKAPGLPPAPLAAEPKRTDAPAPQNAPPAPPAVPTDQTSSGSTSPSGPSTAVRVGGNAQPAQLISRTNPSYPFAARNGHMQGNVILEGIVGTNGQVKEVNVISGQQVFRKAAVDAVSQWVYKPAILNGKTIEAHLRVEIHFREGM